VNRGRGEVVVTAIGMHTEMGRLSQALSEAPESPSSGRSAGVTATADLDVNGRTGNTLHQPIAMPA